jgi:hypothetical protein
MKRKQGIQIRQENVKPYVKPYMQMTDSLHRKIPKNPHPSKILEHMNSLTLQEIR